MKRTDDEQETVHFQSERIIRIDGQWYFMTREEETVGPFIDRDSALEKLEEYLELHRNVWPEVESMIKQCNMENFSIFIRKLPDGHHYLFMYFEYTGTDIDADNAKMAADPKTQEWWAICEPCQKPLDDREEGEWWADMEEVFYFQG